MIALTVDRVMLQTKHLDITRAIESDHVLSDQAHFFCQRLINDNI